MIKELYGDVDKHDKSFKFSTDFDDFTKKYSAKKWIVVNSQTGNYDESITHIKDEINIKYHGKIVMVDNEKYKAYVGGIYDGDNTIGIIITFH